MLINIDGSKVDGNNFAINSPSIRLDDRTCYKIGITHLNFILENNNDNKELHDNELLCLSTNLVDRSSLNPCQGALYFPFVSKKHFWQDVKFPGTTYNTLALHEIENASFQIIRVHADSPIKLEKIFIQLDISRELTHGWIQ